MTISIQTPLQQELPRSPRLCETIQIPRLAREQLAGSPAAATGHPTVSRSLPTYHRVPGPGGAVGLIERRALSHRAPGGSVDIRVDARSRSVTLQRKARRCNKPIVV